MADNKAERMDLGAEIDAKTMIAHCVLEMADADAIKAITATDGYDVHDVEISIAINGVPVAKDAVERMFRMMWEQLKERIEKPEIERLRAVAREMLDERFAPLLDTVFSITNDLDRVVEVMYNWDYEGKEE